MSSQNEISPLQFTTELKKIYNGHPLKDFDIENNWSEIEKVFEMAKIMIAPKPHIHGKKCSNCHHLMHCKSIKCPNCFKEQRKRKRQVPAVPQPAPVEVAEVVLITSSYFLYMSKRDGITCNICKQGNLQKHVRISGFGRPGHCRHKYCFACMLPQLENNIMQCHHCTIGAIKNGKELLDRMISYKEYVDQRARWEMERKEREKKELEDVNVA